MEQTSLQYDRCSDTKMVINDRDTERSVVTKAEIGGMRLQGKKCHGECGNLKLGRSKEGSSTGFREKMALKTP